MEILRLTEPVIIRAPNFWGFPAEIEFSPSPHPGWWWQVDSINQVLMDHFYADCSKLRTRLIFRKSKLEVYEHIGILKWFGLDNVVVRSTTWPPHFGSALAMWQRLKPYCQKDSRRVVSWQTVKERVCWLYPKPRGSNVGFTEILPAEKPGIDLEVVYSYEPIGERSYSVSSLNSVALEEICRYPSQGIHSLCHSIMRLTSLIGWPERQTITWPKDHTPEETMHRFVLHRTADLLGAFSLLCDNKHMFAAKIISHHAGHEADINAIKEAAQLLTPL